MYHIILYPYLPRAVMRELEFKYLNIMEVFTNRDSDAYIVRPCFGIDKVVFILIPWMFSYMLKSKPFYMPFHELWLKVNLDVSNQYKS